MEMSSLHDDWSDSELVNTVADRQRVSDMLRGAPDLLAMLGLS